MKKFQDILTGGDLRSIGKANKIVAQVNDQTTFDELFKGLTNSDRIVVMRTADAIEKITSLNARIKKLQNAGHSKTSVNAKNRNKYFGQFI